MITELWYYLSEVSAKLFAASRIEAGRIARDHGWL